MPHRAAMYRSTACRRSRCRASSYRDRSGRTLRGGCRAAQRSTSSPSGSGRSRRCRRSSCAGRSKYSRHASSAMSAQKARTRSTGDVDVARPDELARLHHAADRTGVRLPRSHTAVQEENERPLCRLDARASRGESPTVLLLENPSGNSSANRTARDVAAPVRGAVVDDDQLCIETASLDGYEKCIDRPREVSRFVVGRHDDGKSRDRSPHHPNPVARECALGWRRGRACRRTDRTTLVSLLRCPACGG